MVWIAADFAAGFADPAAEPRTIMPVPPYRPWNRIFGREELTIRILTAREADGAPMMPEAMAARITAQWFWRAERWLHSTQSRHSRLVSLCGASCVRGTMTEIRKIAAIPAADVVGFSRMASADEDGTLARLRTLRSELIDPTVASQNGRVFKRTGDGGLSREAGRVRFMLSV
jgi:hypothetical protein